MAAALLQEFGKQDLFYQRRASLFRPIILFLGMQQQQVHQDLEMKMKLKKKTLETHTPPPQMNPASIFAFSLSSKVQRETDPKFFSSFLLCVCVTKRGEREREREREREW
jgi:hypothetical protein